MYLGYVRNDFFLQRPGQIHIKLKSAAMKGIPKMFLIIVKPLPGFHPTTTSQISSFFLKDFQPHIIPVNTISNVASKTPKCKH